MKLIELIIETKTKTIEKNPIDYKALGIPEPEEELEYRKSIIHFPVQKFIDNVFYFFEYEDAVCIEFLDGTKMVCYNSIEDLKKLYDTDQV